jgi:hypothetical protein
MSRGYPDISITSSLSLVDLQQDVVLINGFWIIYMYFFFSGLEMKLVALQMYCTYYMWSILLLLADLTLAALFISWSGNWFGGDML